ncbi:hypothetical protein M0804_013827 [Polistes exclamans]|nr:hypothetical protein M0804_013827 [Polistes exclamans]
MAQNPNAQISLEQFKLRLEIWRDAIPIYEGGTTFLSHFLQTCDKFVENLMTSDDAINTSLFALIKSKIRGEALALIVSNSPANWATCKTLLINRYSDASSEELLFSKLNTCYQLPNQSYESYADEIKQRLNKLKEHVQLNIQDAQLIMMKFNFYENVAKNVFISGIREPYHTHLTHFELGDIEACLAKCRRLESYEQQAAFLNFTRQREIKPKPNGFGMGTQSRNSNPFNVPGTSGNGNFFRPFQPQPVTARAPPRALTNFENNFGKGSNNQPGQQNYRFTPMSMGAGNTSGLKGNLVGRSNNLPTSNNNVAKPNNFVPRGSNFFRNTGPSHFISEELYNQEEQEETPECQGELPFINDNVDDQGNGEIADAENFQGDRDFTKGT